MWIGASTRAALSLRRAAQARAVVDGRDFTIPEDVRERALDVLAHRISVANASPETRGTEESRWIVQEILDRVPVPL